LNRLTICFLALMATVASGLARADAVDFELTDLDQQTHRLADYRGEWVVVNYWATWCAPCRKEIPDFSELHDRREDITVLGLAFEDAAVEDFERFLVNYPASYPILLVDTFNPPPDLGAPRALPTTHLVDHEGRLVQTWLGPVTGVMIEQWIADNG